MENNHTLNKAHKQLYLKFCQGDQQASKELVTTFEQRIYAYIRRAFFSGYRNQYVNDYVQLTWLKLIESCSGVLKHDNIGGFIISIARNAVIDEIKKLNAKCRVQNEEYKIETTNIEHNEALNPEHLLELIDKEAQYETKKTLFKQALAKLHLVQRQALYLHLQGHSIAEIAVITNEKEETIKSRIRYAKKKIKKIINELLEV